MQQSVVKIWRAGKNSSSKRLSRESHGQQRSPAAGTSIGHPQPVTLSGSSCRLQADKNWLLHLRLTLRERKKDCFVVSQPRSRSRSKFLPEQKPGSASPTRKSLTALR